MIVEVAVKTCDICGYQSDSKGIWSDEPLRKCAATPRRQVTDLKIGQEILMYWRHHDRGRYVLDSEPSRWGISGIRYSGYGHMAHAGWPPFANPLPLHSLVVTVAQDFRNVPWTPQSTGYSFVSMSYEHFLLMQEGNVTKLEEAGLVARPKASFWNRFLHRRA